MAENDKPKHPPARLQAAFRFAELCHRKFVEEYNEELRRVFAEIDRRRGGKYGHALRAVQRRQRFKVIDGGRA